MKENTGRLAGKVAIVTGGYSGMGASTVELILVNNSTYFSDITHTSQKS